MVDYYHNMLHVSKTFERRHADSRGIVPFSRVCQRARIALGIHTWNRILGSIKTTFHG